MHHLKETIKKYNTKIVIISDIAGFFLDKDIPEDEAQRIFSQVTTFLSNFARENQIIVITTYPSHDDTPRNASLQTLTCSRANVVLSLRKTSYARQFVLEKHPYLSHGVAELPLEDFTLLDFAEGNA
jgi:archaellum biogenesis ATPase FlaH